MNRSTQECRAEWPTGETTTCGCPQKAVCGGIPCPFLEPLARSWSHFVGIYRQNLTRSLENRLLRYPHTGDARRPQRGEPRLCVPSCQHPGHRPPPQDPTVALFLGTYGDPRGVGVSYQRDTPAAPPETRNPKHGARTIRNNPPAGNSRSPIPRDLW